MPWRLPEIPFATRQVERTSRGWKVSFRCAVGNATREGETLPPNAAGEADPTSTPPLRVMSYHYPSGAATFTCRTGEAFRPTKPFVCQGVCCSSTTGLEFDSVGRARQNCCGFLVLVPPVISKQPLHSDFFLSAHCAFLLCLAEVSLAEFRFVTSLQYQFLDDQHRPLQNMTAVSAGEGVRSITLLNRYSWFCICEQRHFFLAGNRTELLQQSLPVWLSGHAAGGLQGGAGAAGPGDGRVRRRRRCSGSRRARPVGAGAAPRRPAVPRDPRDRGEQRDRQCRECSHGVGPDSQMISISWQNTTSTSFV